LEHAIAAGAEEKDLLAEAGLARDDIADPDARIPTARYAAMLQAAASRCADPAFALHFASAVRLEEVSIVGLIGKACATIGEGRRQLNRFASLVIDADGVAPEMMALARDETGIWLELTSPIFSAYPILAEAALTRFVCGLINSGLPLPGAVHFRHAEPDWSAEHRRILGTSVVFASNRNGVLVDEAFLDTPLPPSSRYVFTLLCERADALLADLRSSGTLRARVEGAVMQSLHCGETGMEAVARQLGLSPSTLYRQLEAEGVRYETVIDELRKTMALQFLDAGKTSVSEIAYLLGFSEASAFSRAFRRWTGQSPKEYRNEDK
jgi:AraC-like DNA-binding protein